MLEIRALPIFGVIWNNVLEQHCPVQGQFERGSDRAKAINRAVGKMIAIDLRPFSVVENDGFKELVDLLEPRYDLPSRRYFADTVIPELYNEVVRNLKADLHDAVPGVSLTTDMWQSHQKIEYMAVTMHWASWRDNKVRNIEIIFVFS